MVLAGSLLLNFEPGLGKKSAGQGADCPLADPNCLGQHVELLREAVFDPEESSA
jgi:hypothetical protein